MQMKSSISFVPFLLLFLLSTTQGIRLERASTSPSYHEIHEERSSIEGSAVGEVVICKDGHCSGRSRKLMTMAKPTSKSTENKGVEVEPTPNNASSKLQNSEQRHSAVDNYPDVTDIVRMDYSPARRKPPIHN